MSRLPDYDLSLARHLRENQRQMLRQVQSSAFNRSGMTVTAENTSTVHGTLVVEGSVVVEGNVDVSDLGRITFPAGGSLLMRDTHGRDYLYAGGVTTTGFAMTLTRIDGSLALVFADDSPTTELAQVIRLLDRNGYLLIGEDPSGEGASWPLAPIQFVDMTWQNWPNNTTGAFAAVQSALTYKSSPRIYVACQAICDGTATGSVQLKCNGTAVGSAVAVPNLAFVGPTFGTPAAVAGSIGDALSLSLETMVTAGAGKCYAKVTAALAWPS